MSLTLKYRWLGLIAKAGIIVLVLLGIGLAVRKALMELESNRRSIAEQSAKLMDKLEVASSPEETQSIRQEMESLRKQNVSFAKIKWLPFLAAFLLTLLGLLPAGLYWFLALRSFRQEVDWLHTQEAYYLGHLGKYIPGKAMVFVLRLGRLRQLHVPVAIGVASIFAETLTVMAVGATVGGLMLLATKPPIWLVVSVWGCVVASAIPTLPGLFRFVVTKFAKSKIGNTVDLIGEGLSWKLFLQGWFWLSVGWLIQGLAAWLTVLAIVPSSQQLPLVSLGVMAICTSAASLSVVAGFVSFLPGGAGVRELVMIVLLGTVIGTPPALMVAIVLRLMSLAAEAILFGIFNMMLRLAKRRLML